MAIDLSLNKLPWYGQVLVFVALSIAGGVVFWTCSAKPAQASIAERQQQLATLRAEIERDRATARRLPDFRRQAVELEAQLDTLRGVLPSDQDVADLLRRVQAMATESNLTIRGFAPQAVARKQLHAEWPFGLQLEGTYHNFGAFLERLGRFPRIINVSNLKLAARDAQSAAATVAVDCTAMTFVLLDTPAPETPAKAGKEARDERAGTAVGTPATATLPPTVGAAPFAATGFTYNPEGRRDPFVSLLRRGTDEAAQAVEPRKPGLPGLGVGEVILKGTMASRGGYIALLKGADAKTYIVRPGDRLRDGAVQAVTADAVVLLQRVDDPLSPQKERQVRKLLRQPEEDPK